MVGTELLETGQLSVAIERVAGEVKARPTDLAARTFYFELLCLNGDLERAGKQLEVLGAASAEMIGGASIYLGAIQAEKERRQFFHGGPRPRVLDDPPYSNAQLEAVEHYAAGDSSSAARLLQASSEQLGELRGTLNGTQIDELADTNDLLGPFLEVVMDGHYTWIPWASVQLLSVAEPRYLRDTVWAPATLALHSGSHGEVLVFALYVDSHSHPDDVKLGRRTIWPVDASEFTLAYGQKVVASGEIDCPLLQLRTLEVASCP
jgi:type VI secretion system protein ImpE